MKNGSVNQVAIFNSVFSRLLESFAPNFYQFIADFESAQINTSIIAQVDYSILDNLLETFPRTAPTYSEVLKTLTAIAACNTAEILRTLSKICNKLFKFSQNTPFAALQSLSPIFDQGNKHHQLLFHYFALIFTTDLICQIVVNYGADQTVSYLSRTGQDLCTSPQPLPRASRTLVKQWSVIFSIVSETDFTVISHIFDMFDTTTDVSTPFQLIRFVRLDINDALGQLFMEKIITQARVLQRKKAITPEILDSLTSLIVTFPFNEDLFNRMLDLTYNLRLDKDLSLPAINFLIVLMLRLPKQKAKLDHLFQKRVLSNAGDDNKLKQSLNAFTLMMFGRDSDPLWLFWEWGSNPRASQFSYIKWNGMVQVSQSDSRSFSSLFMQHYFPKSNFALCPIMFRNILIHLASLDFNHFVNNIVPKFLALNPSDPRFIVMIMTVKPINCQDFIENSYNKVTNEMVNKYNTIIRPKVIELLAIYREVENNSGVCIDDSDFMINSIIEESNQKISIILDQWGLKVFGPLLAKLITSEYSKNDFSLHSHIVQTFPYIFTKEDFKNDIMCLILRLSFNHNRIIAESSYSLCCEIMTKTDLDYLSPIFDTISGLNSPESVFTGFSILLKIMTQPGNKSISEADYLKIECATFIGLASAYPPIRRISYTILELVNKAIEDKGIISFINKFMDELECNAKKHVLQFLALDKPQEVPLAVGTIQFEVAVCSNHYDIWLFFLEELMYLVIDLNYTPILTRMVENYDLFMNHYVYDTNAYSPTSVGISLIFVSAMFNPKITKKYRIKNEIELFEPYAEKQKPKTFIVDLFKRLLSNDIASQEQLALNVIPHIHFSLFPDLIEILGSVPNDKCSNATWTLLMMLKSPKVSSKFIEANLTAILSFLSNMQYFFIKFKINGPRVIVWDNESESRVQRFAVHIKSFCYIANLSFSSIRKKLKESEWPLSSRQVIFRFLVNWSMTKAPSLASVRDYAGVALCMIVRVGKVFSDGLLFDEAAVKLFGKIEIAGMPVLVHLLNNHLELLLDKYIDACYTQPRGSADFYFEAIMAAMKENISSDQTFFQLLSGNLILLALVYSQREHPKVESFLELFLSCVGPIDGDPGGLQNLIDLSKSAPPKSFLPNYFQYATEAIFDNVFNLLKSPNLHVPVKDIIEAVRPWIQVIRLLPKQTTCAQNVGSSFGYFTPYQFLWKLMETTEAVDDDQFRSIASIWIELLKSPDHSELIPSFICSWRNPSTKKKMFGILIEANPDAIVQRFVNRCSFAYYYHVTQCMKEPFKDELWFSSLLANAFMYNWSHLFPHVTSVIHFSILFKDKGALDLFEVLCKKLQISRPIGEISIDSIGDLVIQFIDRLSKIEEEKQNSNSNEVLAVWGNEALKWLFASPSLEIGTISFIIYNKIKKPYAADIVNNVIRIVSYHLEYNSSDAKLLTKLIDESFYFFTNIVKEYGGLAFKYASAFIDCRVFVESCLIDALNIFLNGFSLPEATRLLKTSVISLVRPILMKLETESYAREIISSLILKTRNEDLMMIIVPFNKVNPMYFPKAPPIPDILSHVSDSAFCKALSNYTILLMNASRQLMDAIFEVCALIVHRVVDANNKLQLAKIYTSALHSITKCPNAIEFIKVVSQRQPDVAAVDFIDVYEWDRSVEDVVRNVKLLAVPDESPLITLTECPTYTSVTRFLYSDVTPKILPFESERELLDGMSSVQRIKNTRKTLSQQTTRLSMPPLVKDSSILEQIVVSLDSSFAPLIHPKELLFYPQQFQVEYAPTETTTMADFLSGTKRSMSVAFPTILKRPITVFRDYEE